MSHTVEQLWSEPVDPSRSIPITLVMDDNLPLLARENEIVYDLADKARKSWNYYKQNAVTETTLSLYGYAKFVLGCYLLTKYKYWFYIPRKHEFKRQVCIEAQDLLESGRVIKWRLF